MKDAKDVAEIIDSVLKDSGLERAVDLWKIYKVFYDIFSDGAAGNIKILSLRDGLLRLQVPSSVWVQELSFMEQGIIDKINASIGNNPVEHIRFTEV